MLTTDGPSSGLTAATVGATKVSYGWVIVGAGIVVTCLGSGSLMSLSVFLPAMTESMGWSRTGISMAALLGFICMGLGSLCWGALSDRFGTRLVVLSGGLLLGLGLVTASQATSLVQFQVLYGLLVGFAVGGFYAPLIATTIRWFTGNRSLAVALVSAGLGLGSTTIGPLASWLIATYDWRFAMLAIGGLTWLVILPLAWLFRAPPTPTPSPAATAAAAGAGGREFTAAEAFRTPQFAAIALTHFACCAAHSGPIFHMVSHAIDHGITALAAATVLSTAGLASLSGRLICGLLADRLGAKRILLVSLAVQALSVSLYVFTADLPAFYAVALMFGFAYGGVMPLYAILVREYFGARIMGTAFGGVALLSTLGMALGPWAGGWLYDALGSYFWLYLGSFGIGAGAVAIAFTFRPPGQLLTPLARPSLAS